MFARHRPRGKQTGLLLLLVLLTLLGGLVGFATGAWRAGQFTAESTVLVAPLDGNPYSPGGKGDDLVNLETEAQLVSSDAVARAVLEDVGGTSTTDLLNGLHVTVPTNTQILVISYTAPNGATARSGARGFAQAFLNFRSKRADRVATAQAERIQNEIDTQTSELNDLVKKQSAEKLDVRKAVLQKQISGATSQIGQLRTALTTVQTGEVDPGQVLTPAHVVTRDPRDNKIIFATAGALFGLALAALVIFSVARVRRLTTLADEGRVTRSVDGAPTEGASPRAADSSGDALRHSPYPDTPIEASVGPRHNA